MNAKNHEILRSAKYDIKVAFTLAEVLIALVIIGIIAVLTVPPLIQSTQDKEYKAARDKVLLTIGQAGRTMAANGLLNQPAGTTAETFVKNYFSKYVKIAKMCGSASDNLEECGLPTKIKPLSSEEEIDMPTTISGLSSVNSSNMSGYAFTLANGYGINLFYNPLCVQEVHRNSIWESLSYVCINAIYDMNGLKKPNKVGKDIGFVSVLYPNLASTSVAPIVYKEDAEDGKTYNWNDAQKACTEIDKNLVVPNKEELLSVNYNNNLLGLANAPYWSSSEVSDMPEYAFIQLFFIGHQNWNVKDNKYQVRCIWK